MALLPKPPATPIRVFGEIYRGAGSKHQQEDGTVVENGILPTIPDLQPQITPQPSLHDRAPDPQAAQCDCNSQIDAFKSQASAQRSAETSSLSTKLNAAQASAASISTASAALQASYNSATQFLANVTLYVNSASSAAADATAALSSVKASASLAMAALQSSAAAAIRAAQASAATAPVAIPTTIVSVTTIQQTLVPTATLQGEPSAIISLSTATETFLAATPPTISQQTAAPFAANDSAGPSVSSSTAGIAIVITVIILALLGVLGFLGYRYLKKRSMRGLSIGSPQPMMTGSFTGKREFEAERYQPGGAGGSAFEITTSRIGKWFAALGHRR